MVDYNKADITIVLDRSGSMSSIRSDVIGGLNQFFEDQRKLTQDVRVSLYQFDDQFEPNYIDVPIKHVKDLSNETYLPRGSTALLDAIGRTINLTGQRLSELSEEKRPGKVILVIQTDGLENASYEFNVEKIKEMIKHQTDKYNWQFLFLGANIDAVSVSSSIGIFAANALNYAPSYTGVNALYGAVSNKAADFIAGRATSVSFTDSEKHVVEQHVGK